MTYRWDPTVGEQKRSIAGVPKADPAITLASKACVPVTLGIDVVDTLGTTGSAPGGKIAQHCDAKASGLARTVYLDPLAPPAAPGNVTWARCRGYDGVYRDVEACAWLGRPSDLGWSDRSDNESGFRVFARPVTLEFYGSRCQRTREVPGQWVLVQELPTGTVTWRVDLSSLPRAWQRGWPGSSPSSVEFSIAAFNRAGESQRVGGATLVNENPVGGECQAG